MENQFRYNSDTLGPLARRACLVILSTLLSASTVWGHGTKRHFGTVVNGHGRPTLQRGSEGSPAFTLLAIESSSNGILRAVEAERPGEARERASRLLELVEELHRRSEGLDPSQRARAAAATEAIAATALQLDVAADASDGPSLRREIAELKRLMASMQRFLRESSEP